MRTQQERDDMVQALLKVKPTVPSKTGFGDSNWDAIDAQVEVIRKLMAENRIYDKWEDDDHVRDNALEARMWLDGEEEKEGQLLTGWQSLVGVKVRPVEEWLNDLDVEENS